MSLGVDSALPECPQPRPFRQPLLPSHNRLLNARQGPREQIPPQLELQAHLLTYGGLPGPGPGVLNQGQICPPGTLEKSGYTGCRPRRGQGVLLAQRG